MLKKIVLATLMMFVVNSGQVWASSSDEEVAAVEKKNHRSTPTTFEMEGLPDDSDEGSDVEDKSVALPEPKVTFSGKAKVISVVPAESSKTLTAAEIAGLSEEQWEKHFHAEMAAVEGDQKATQIVLHKWMDASAPRVPYVRIMANK